MPDPQKILATVRKAADLMALNARTVGLGHRNF